MSTKPRDRRIGKVELLVHESGAVIVSGGSKRNEAVAAVARRVEAFLAGECGPASEGDPTGDTTSGDEGDDMLSEQKPYTGGAESLSLAMPASFTIQLDEPWTRTVVATGGSGNYTYRQVRLPHDYDLSQGVRESDLEVLGAEDGQLYGNGNTRNHKLWLVQVTDTDTGQVFPADLATADWMQLTIDGYDGIDNGDGAPGGDGGELTPDDQITPALSVRATYSGTRTGPNNTFAAGDTVEVSVTVTNAENDAPLTGVRIVGTDGLTFSGGLQSLPAFGDSYAYTADYVLTSQDVTAGRKTFEFSVTSNETAPSEPQIGLLVPAGNAVVSVFSGPWVEVRNITSDTADAGVSPVFPRFNFAHTKVYSLSSSDVGGDTSNPKYVANVIAKARAEGVTLQIQLGSSGDYGWDFTANRGNFNLDKWKDGVARFAVNDQPANNTSGTLPGDPVGGQVLLDAIADGTVRYIMMIDEPMHQRWSPTWNGKVGKDATGDRNHITNAHLDEMAQFCKSLFGNDVKTNIRTPPINLLSGRGGLYSFQHLTHAQITLSPNRWNVAGTPGPNKGFEWYFTIKNNIGGVTEYEAFTLQNLKPIGFVQFGFESISNPWTAGNNFRNLWWENEEPGYVRDQMTNLYVKASPWECDFMAKSWLSPRDPVTGVLDPSGQRLIDDVHFFRWDRLPTDNGYMAMSTFPYYQRFFQEWQEDMVSGTLATRSGLPIGMDFDPYVNQSWRQDAF